jgi:hypothetical protein
MIVRAPLASMEVVKVTVASPILFCKNFRPESASPEGDKAAGVQAAK